MLKRSSRDRQELRAEIYRLMLATMRCRQRCNRAYSLEHGLHIALPRLRPLLASMPSFALPADPPPCLAHMGQLALPHTSHLLNFASCNVLVATLLHDTHVFCASIASEERLRVTATPSGGELKTLDLAANAE